MRKVIVIALVASLGLCIPQAQAIDRMSHCRYKTAGGPGWSRENIKDTARCAARKTNINVTKFLSVVSCESGFYADPGGAGHGYHGPMQYASGTFDSHYRMFPDFIRWHDLLHGVHRVRTNVMIAARFVQRSGYGPWSYGRCA